MLPKAVSTMVGGIVPASRKRSSRPKPSNPGMLRSVRMTSAGNQASFSKASLPSAAVSGIMPHSATMAASPLRWLASSSTIKTLISGWSIAGGFISILRRVRLIEKESGSTRSRGEAEKTEESESDSQIYKHGERSTFEILITLWFSPRLRAFHEKAGPCQGKKLQFWLVFSVAWLPTNGRPTPPWSSLFFLLRQILTFASLLSKPPSAKLSPAATIRDPRVAPGVLLVIPAPRGRLSPRFHPHSC